MFNAGTTGNVVVSNTGTTGFVIADAVMFETAVLDTIVVDNPDATLTGTWVTSSATPGYVDDDYLHDNNANKGTKTATYTPNLSQAGLWEVQINYTSGSNRATNVPVDIYSLDGMTTVTVNQTSGGGTWQSLGFFNFDAGTGGSAVIRTTGTDNYVVADAFRFQLISLIPEPTTATLAAILIAPTALRRRRPRS